MERIDKTIEYDEYNIYVFRGLSDSNDTNWNQEISFTLSKSKTTFHGKLILKPLWFVDEDEIDNPDFKYKKQYEIGDYFQQTFNAVPVHKGIGSVLHNFLIEHKNEFELNNVYSTKNSEDNHVISEDANSFWLNRVENNNAVFDSNVERYKILFD